MNEGLSNIENPFTSFYSFPWFVVAIVGCIVVVVGMRAGVVVIEVGIVVWRLYAVVI